ncbi:outer membrane protein assembly factor BamB family protein [Mycobacterium sp. C31M]
MTVVVGVIGVGALSGRNVSRTAAALLAATVALTAWVYLGSVVESTGVRISGLGARPALVMAQIAWPLFAVSAALLLIGAVWAVNTRLSVRRSLLAILSPWAAVGLTASVVAGVGVSVFWMHGQSRPLTAEPTAAAPFPSTVGTEIAYSIQLHARERVLPAGPGFAVFSAGGGITAYDGGSGAPRWNVPAEVFPTDCRLRAMRSTGVSDDAVIVAECGRPQLHSVRPVNPEAGEPVLMGFDANTGRALWLNDDGFKLAEGAGTSASMVAVSRRNEEVGPLDPRTGTVAWVRPGAEHPCGGSASVVGEALVLVSCFDEAQVRVLDGATGDDRTIDLPVTPTQPNVSTLEISRLAADGTLLILQTKSQKRSNPGESQPLLFQTWSIDIDTGTVSAIPSVAASIPRPPLPGPLIQLGAEHTEDQTYQDVYSLPARALIRARGLSVSSVFYDALQWAMIGGRPVTAAARADDAMWVASVGPDGSVTRTPSPCPTGDASRTRGASILPVPGAILVLCPHSEPKIDGRDLLGLQ